MIYVENPNMGLASLNVGGQVYVPSRPGIYSVTEADALFLCSTPGWKRYELPAHLAAGTPAPVMAAAEPKKGGKKPRRAPPPPVKDESAASAPPETAEPPAGAQAPQTDSEPETEEGPDLTVCLTLESLLKVADEYGVDVPDRASLEDEDVPALRRFIDKAIFGDGA